MRREERRATPWQNRLTFSAAALFFTSKGHLLKRYQDDNNRWLWVRVVFTVVLRKSSAGKLSQRRTRHEQMKGDGCSGTDNFCQRTWKDTRKDVEKRAELISRKPRRRWMVVRQACSKESTNNLHPSDSSTTSLIAYNSHGCTVESISYSTRPWIPSFRHFLT